MASHDINKGEAYNGREFMRRTGCHENAAYGFGCDAYGRTTALATIMTKQTKPQGVSDVRWRIELRRRAMAREMGAYYMGYQRTKGNN